LDSLKSKVFVRFKICSTLVDQSKFLLDVCMIELPIKMTVGIF